MKLSFASKKIVTKSEKSDNEATMNQQFIRKEPKNHHGLKSSLKSKEDETKIMRICSNFLMTFWPWMVRIKKFRRLL